MATRAERQVERQLHDAVVTGQVGRPQETLLAKLDTCRKKAVQREPDRHLQQNRQTAPQRIDAVGAVQFHGFNAHSLLIVTVFLFE